MSYLPWLPKLASLIDIGMTILIGLRGHFLRICLMGKYSWLTHADLVHYLFQHTEDGLYKWLTTIVSLLYSKFLAQWQNGIGILFGKSTWIKYQCSSCASKTYAEINFGQTELIAGLHYWYLYGYLRVYCKETILLSNSYAFTGEQKLFFRLTPNVPSQLLLAYKLLLMVLRPIEWGGSPVTMTWILEFNSSKCQWTLLFLH